jgi:histidinol-phosphatase
VSTTAALEQANMITGGLRWSEDRRPGLLDLVARTQRDRGFGDFWGHVLVAEGAAELMVELAPLALWDVAAPRCVVEQAGGRFTDLDGGTALAPGPCVSSNGLVHAAALAALRVG